MQNFVALSEYVNFKIVGTQNFIEAVAPLLLIFFLLFLMIGSCAKSDEKFFPQGRWNGGRMGCIFIKPQYFVGILALFKSGRQIKPF